ncbi:MULTISPECIES: nuclear transport factor 2 family protein [Microbacterium]|uniref:Nuclear transport factor 2 family protein n=1 Tax=Microbacterium wangchenii TaxID=2541726 RepID=A0ABX5SNQ4_9MICO|nr:MULTISPECIES: nuclear transport factor 2 family protein [Microbacterium]MCK6068117.1 nuclear transport factor 2 family protein [Microbacterium sp. EYE_512]QBR87761.1 nuclear transport factor 2 family protein [Microbacterium wangchenii]
MNDIVAGYLATWNARPEERSRLLAEHFAPSVSYTDPLAQVSGRGELDRLIDGVQAQFPGFVFTPVGATDSHHDQVRFQWGLGPDGAEPVVIGFDVVVLDGEGRVADVRGFLDKVPA